MKPIKYSCIILFLIIAVSCNYKNNNSNSDVIALVNDEAMSKSELKHWMLLEKAGVYNYFYQTYQVSDNEDFWKQPLGDEIPLNRLRDVALHKAVRCKVQLMMARDKGIVKTADFDEIIKELDSVNKSRRHKYENGEPIYGPIQFTSRTYYFDLFDKTVIELKNILATNDLKPSQETLKELQQNSNATIEFLAMQYVDDNYEKFIDQLTDEATIAINHKVYMTACFD